MVRILASVVILLLGACAGAASRGVRVAEPPHPATPDEIERADEPYTGAGGLALYAQRWRPRTGEIRGAVVIHHGLADHSDRYAPVAIALARKGYAVWALEMRGHGRSSGRRVHFDSIDQLVGDLERFVAIVRAREPGVPLFVVGHSIGGLVTALYGVERRPDVAGIALLAPALSFEIPVFSAGALRLAAAIAPDAPLLEVKHAQFSSDPAVTAAMARDPLLEKPRGPARSSRSAIDGVSRVWAHPEQLVVPLLIMHGTGDEVTAAAGSRDLVARAGGTDRTLRLYEGLKHDLVHEPDGGGARVTAELGAWLDAHTGGAAIAFEAPPARRLRGDRGAMALAVELDARGERSGDESGATAGLRLRVGRGRATALGLGWTGGVDVRGGYLDGGVYEADAYPLGLALRGSGGALLALAAGVGIGGVRGAGATHLPIEAALELPLGPVRVLARGSLGWRLGGDEYAGEALGGVDEAGAALGVRLGRDRRYWPTTAAGSGPFLGVTYRNLGSADVWGLALGAQIWGGN